VWSGLLPVLDGLINNTIRTVTFIGAAGSGKTVGAVGLFRKLLDVAGSASGLFDKTDATRLITRTAEAKFIAARDLLPHPETGARPKIHDALRASVLLLDDLGGEVCWNASHRAKTAALIKDIRDFGDRTIIVTSSFHDSKVIANLYGDGAAVRLFGWQVDAGVVVVDCDERKVYRAQ
jgi:hypothetical protein